MIPRPMTKQTLLLILSIGVALLLLTFVRLRRPVHDMNPPEPPRAPAPLAATPPPPPDPLEAAIALVRPSAGRQEKDGIAIALLMDTSGSMKDPVRDSDGTSRAKIDIAKRVCRKTIGDLQEFAAKTPELPLSVGLYEFSGGSCRAILPLGPFQPEETLAAVDRLRPSQGTPIGEAILTAKGALDQSGLFRKHMVLLTDGENTTGRDPVLFARAIAALPPEEQAGIHCIAFQVQASKFQGIKDAGGTVLEATNAAELGQSMDFILRRKILLELPEVPVKK